MPAFNLIYRPWVNSYRRMNRLLFNPENASWGRENHTVGLRVVHGPQPEKMTRFEHRAPGADINPYLSIASILEGCARGLRAREEPPAYAKGDAMLDERWHLLPHSMPEAIERFRASPAATEAFGVEFVEHLACIKQDEWKDFIQSVPDPEKALASGSPISSWEATRYFHHA
jgi:glutamine synthetase